MAEKITHFVILITMGLTLMGCPSPQNTSKPNNALATQNDTASSTAKKTGIDSVNDNGCVFDTASFKFTTEKIIAYNSKLPIIWDDSAKLATVPLGNNDTMTLHIGGCDHFSFEATYSTDTAKFGDDAFLMEKAQWLATTFFDQGYDSKYKEVFAKKQYHLSPSAEPDTKWYQLAISDTTLTDHVYEGFTFKKENGRTEVWIGGYTN